MRSITMITDIAAQGDGPTFASPSHAHQTAHRATVTWLDIIDLDDVCQIGYEWQPMIP